MDKKHKKEEEYKYFTSLLNYHQDDNILYLQLVEGTIALEFITADIVRIVMGKKDELSLKRTVAMVIDELKYIDFVIKEEENYLEINTESLQIKINKENFRLSFYDQLGQLIHQDKVKKAIGWSKTSVVVHKELRKGERFYGLGEKTGWLDKKHREYTMWNTDNYNSHNASVDPLYQSIPFLLGYHAKKAYGIYLDNSYLSKFDLGYTEQQEFSILAEGGTIDYYFINGPDLKDVLKKYSNLTGKPFFPPKWSLGFHQSRYSYYPEDKVLELADNFRRKDIPCDVIHLDIHYMDEYQIFTWDEARFPEFKGMINQLEASGFKTITIIDPGIKKDVRNKLYQEGITNDYFCKYIEGDLFTGDVWPGECVFPDFTQEKVRNWWADKQRIILDQGVKGIWNDMNEPAVFNESLTMDIDVLHKNDGDAGTHRRFHNLYALLENMATYQGMIRNNPEERPFILTRAGFAGIQRYAAVWTGDNRSIWEHLELAMPMLMNLGMSGVAFCGVDIGGFGDNTNPELLTRWMQLGTFMPFCRNHTAVGTKEQEPWAFGEKYEKIIKDYIKLRYRFLDYLYNLFYQATETGLAIIRPLILEFPEDKQVENMSDQFMVGESLLIAPVYKPDAKERLVYLPEGNWYDFWSNKQYEGGQRIIVSTPLEKMPIFIKAGSIIPLLPPLNYVDEKKIENIEINIYLDHEVDTNSFLLYEDDGHSFNYKAGKYNLTEIKYSVLNDRIKIKLEDFHLEYTGYQKYEFILKNISHQPEKLMVDDVELADWDYQLDKLKFKVASDINILEIMF